MPINEVVQTNKQHAVPQNIMQVEFKVIGSLTMRQFFYLVIAAIFAFGALRSGLPSFLRLPVALLIAGAGVAIAFVPVEERGLDQWVANFINAIYTPTQRIWRKEIVPPSYFLYQNLAMLKSELMAVAPTASRRKLEQYLEREGAGAPKDPLDIAEDYFINKVKEAYGGVVTTTEEPKQVFKPLRPYTPEVKGLEPEIKEVGAPKPPKPVEEIPQKPEATPFLEAEITLPQAEEPKISPAQVIIPHQYTPKFYTGSPITPDRLAGRRFTHLSRTEGEIVLPVRGERVVKPTEEKAESDLSLKTRQLTELVEKIKKGQQPKEKKEEAPAAKVEEATKGTIQKGASQAVAQLKTDNQRLEKEIEELKKKAGQAGSSKEEKDQITNQIKNLQTEKEQADREVALLQQRIFEMEQKIKEMGSEQPRVIVQKVVEKVHVPVIPSEFTQGAQAQAPLQKATFSNISPITGVPNIINGVVKDQTQTLLEGAVVIVKDSKGDTVRALKTNKLGQFSITTPVSNGTYVLEVSKEGEKNPMSFDRVSIEVKGLVLPPVEFTGKLKT